MRGTSFGGAAAVAAAVLVLGSGAAWGAPPPAGNPPGNNGTIKVDGAPFDDAPDNEPHPGCSMQLDFYGFDEGDLYADVTFDAIAPTAGGTVLSDRVFIGEDDNAGGGSTDGLDASRTYDLAPALAAIAPAAQGWHVKVTVRADGSQGADVKRKVFWLGDCAPPPPVGDDQTPPVGQTPPADQTPPAPPSGDTGVPVPPVDVPTPPVRPLSTSQALDAPAAPAPTLDVLGADIVRPAAAGNGGSITAVAAGHQGALARTGLDGTIALLGVGLVAGGVALLWLRRARPARSTAV